MPHQLPKLQFLRDRFITLNEGFDRAGRFMFPEEWTGREALAWPKVDPESLKQEQQRLEMEYKNRSQYAARLRRTPTYGMSPEENREHYALLDCAETERQNAREALDQFGHVFDSRYDDAVAYERRRKVESRLCDLIKTGVLDVRLGHGTGVEMHRWFMRDRFHISFAFSFVVAPNFMGSLRRFPAYFAKDSFNIWAQPLT